MFQKLASLGKFMLKRELATSAENEEVVSFACTGDSLNWIYEQSACEQTFTVFPCRSGILEEVWNLI